IERLAIGQVEPREVEGAGQRARREEPLVELAVFVGADALDRGELAAVVDDEDLVGAVDDDHLHLAVGDLVDREQVDPPHRRSAARWEPPAADPLRLLAAPPSRGAPRPPVPRLRRGGGWGGAPRPPPPRCGRATSPRAARAAD